jgi:hypothetical protein
MTVLFCFSPAVFAAGMAAGVLKYGIPESVSESYYLLPPKIRLPVFYGRTVPVAVPPVIFRLDISGGTVRAPVFFGCAAPVFTGAAAPFKDGA